MSEDPRPDVPSPESGSATSPEGTPMAVDVGSDRPTRRDLAMFVAGPVLWFTHFAVVYLVAEAGCTGDGPGLRVFNAPVPAITTIVATVVAAVACLLVARRQYRRWRGARRRGSPSHVPQTAEIDAGAPLAFAGMLLALISVISVLFVGLPALVFTGC